MRLLRRRREHAQPPAGVAADVGAVLREFDRKDWSRSDQQKVRETAGFARLHAAPPEDQMDAVLDALARPGGDDWRARGVLHTLAGELLRRDLPWSEERAARLVRALAPDGGALYASHAPV